MLNRLRTALLRIWEWVTDSSDGPWNYAGCCGCGRLLVDVFLVITDNGLQRPYEMYCRGCWNNPPLIHDHDHIWFDETLISVRWEFADACAGRAIEQRGAMR